MQEPRIPRAVVRAMLCAAMALMILSLLANAVSLPGLERRQDDDTPYDSDPTISPLVVPSSTTSSSTTTSDAQPTDAGSYYDDPTSAGSSDDDPTVSSSSTVAVPTAPVPTSPAPKPDPLLIVKTTSGRVSGKAIGNIYAYRGIPYGKPTSGNRRFRAPQMASYSYQLLDATQYGPACPQLLNNVSRMVNVFTDSHAPTLDQQSEDCLSINVVVSNATRAKASKLFNGKGGAAVMIWTYGGSFSYGTSSSDLYNPEDFVNAQQDIIVVSYNYRTNIFGFPLSPQIRQLDKGTGWNRGLQDRDLAIKWVYQNIAQFGGDPNRITLFGESAGGVSVDSWAFANAGNSNPIVKGLIVQSGAVQGLDLPLVDVTKNWTKPSAPWNTVANLVGCGTRNDLAQLACMQKVEWPAILQAMDTSGAQFGPSVDNKLYFDDWKGRSSRGQFARVPTMIGTNADEGTILSGLFLTDIAGMLAQSALITPLIFTCPAKKEAADRARYGVPVWRYLYHGNWANMNSGIPQLGAYHFSEVPIVFRTYPSSFLSDPQHTVPIPPQQTNVSDWMQGAWAAFARDPQAGLTSALRWPRYAQWTRSLAHIARNNSGVPSFGVPDPLDLGCNLAAPVEGSLYSFIRTVVASGL